MSICAQLEQGVITRSAEECQAWGAALAAELPRDCVLALAGDLGVGKTTLVRGLAKGLGIEANLTSPTFTVFNLYRSPRGVTLVHMDAYRLSHASEMDSLMLEDFLASPYCLALEWPDKVAEWVPKHAWVLELGIEPDQSHRLQLRRPVVG